MRFHAHKTVRLGPLFFTFTERGLAGWGIRVGRFSHDLGRRVTSIHTGWGGLHHRHGRRR